MAGIYTTFAIGTTVLIMIFSVFFWGLTDLASNYNVTVEDLYLESGQSISSQEKTNQKIILESQEISRTSSLDEQATDTAQAQGDISAVKNTAQSSNILQTFISQFQNVIPYHQSITVAILSIISILFVAAGIYLLIGRIP